MKILHTSDWHLGAMDGERYLLDDQRHFIDEIGEIAKANNIDAILIAGDVYDRSVASAEAIKLYDYAMKKYCSELEIPVMIIAGNHDSAERLSTCSELLSKAGLHITGSLKRIPEIVSCGDADIYFLPWITEEKVKSLYPEEKENITTLEAAYKIVTNKMRETFREGKRHIVLSHSFITDSETSVSDRSAEIGFATQVSASVFEGFDYVALGHLHKPQNVTGKIRYSGTPMPYSFGKEEVQTKSVTIIDTADMSQTIVPLSLFHKRTTVEGTLSEVRAPDCDDDTRNGYVRVRVTDCYIGLEALSEIKKCYPNLLEASGKAFENENAAVTMTAEQLEEFESDPTEVFKYFCREEIGEEPDEHIVELFARAIEAAQGED